MASFNNAQGYLDEFSTREPDFWLWAQTRPRLLERLQKLARAAVDGGTAFRKFLTDVQGLRAYQTWTTQGATAPDEDAVEEEPEEADDVTQTALAEARALEDVRDLLRQFLEENQLPGSLMTFIEGALSQGWSYDRIIYELRRTPEYKAAYPENDVRLGGGFDWMPEHEIRAYRSEARRITREYFGYEPSNAEIAELITRNKSLAEWETQVKDYFDMVKYGPAVRQALEWVLGYNIDDEGLWKFFSRDWQTPELDAAYEKAQMMGRPAVLGMGIRPEEEADILRSYGINPEDAFRGYQQIAAELPRTTRLNAIEAEIARLGDRFPAEITVSFMDIFKAAQLRDMDSILKLQQQLAREVARWQAGGGPSGGGAGLLAPENR